MEGIFSSQLVQENKRLVRTAIGPNSVMGVFCLAHTGFLDNSEPRFKNQEISYKYLNFGDVLTIQKA